MNQGYGRMYILVIIEKEIRPILLLLTSIKVIDLPEGGSALAMQHIQINGLSSQAGKLGELMAR